ncbi:hypothetical protein OAI25_02130 [Alphaproteobacteria bacterium]|nr:hypothetical protein [Alphaproteobacteria bacterium]
MYTNASQYVSNRDGVFYYIRRIPHDVRQHYTSSRISFSLRTKSLRTAARAAISVTQRLEDYWLGLRLQQMDIPAIHLVKADDVEDNSPLLLDAVEMYINTKGKTDKTFIRTARRNAAYVAKVLGNKPITSYATSEAAKFRDWCFKLHRDNQLDGCVTNSYFKLTTFRTVQVERDYFLVDRKITASLNINPILD